MTWIRHDTGTPAEEKEEPTLQEPEGRVAHAIATLDPGWFAWVMASGIVSIGADLLGYRLLSSVVLGFTVAATVMLTVAYLARFILYGSWVRRSLRDPTTAMAYFTVVAGLDVLAARLVPGGHTVIALGLGSAAAIIWVALTYGLPWSIVASAQRPVLGEINGTWLVWVVATQSLSILTGDLTPIAPSGGFREALPEVALCLWGVGVMLYFILISIIFLRLLLVEVTPEEMGPAYWIAMGATAISVRAAAGIVDVSPGNPTGLIREMHPFLVGLSVVLWAFGTWWIPLLVALGIWRYVIRRYTWAFEPRLWNIVFPLGMYTVASYALGRAAHLDFMISIARVWVFVGMAVWAIVTVHMAAALMRAGSFRAGPRGRTYAAP